MGSTTIMSVTRRTCVPYGRTCNRHKVLNTLLAASCYQTQSFWVVRKRTIWLSYVTHDLSSNIGTVPDTGTVPYVIQPNTKIFSPNLESYGYSLSSSVTTSIKSKFQTPLPPSLSLYICTYKRAKIVRCLWRYNGWRSQGR